MSDLPQTQTMQNDHDLTSRAADRADPPPAQRRVRRTRARPPFRESLKVRTAILIPSYNRPEDLRYTLSRVLPVLGPDVGLLIVDDASTDPEQWRLLDELAASSEQVAVVRLQERHGCTRARKAALERLDSEYVILLDDDSYFASVSEHLVTRIAARFEADPALAIQAFSVFIPTSEGPPQSEHGVLEDSQLMSWFINCGCAFRMSAYRQIGGYRDEFDSPYGEELDVALRVMEAGWFIRHYAEPRIIHHRSSTARSVAANARGKTKNYLRIAWWYHPPWFAACYSVYLFARILALEWRNGGSCPGVWRGLLEFAGEWTRGLQRRSMQGRTIKLTYGLRHHTILATDEAEGLAAYSWPRFFYDALFRKR